MLAEDPVVRSGRREAVLAIGMWLVAMVYTVGYCYRYGYGRSGEDLTFVLWFPDWIFWGVVVPWLTCVVASTFFAYYVMTDEPLGAEADAPDDESSDGPAARAAADSEARHG